VILLVVARDVSADEVLKLVEKAYATWAKGPARPPIPIEPAQTREQRVTVPWKGASLPMLFMGYHAPGFSHQVDSTDRRSKSWPSCSLPSDRACTSSSCSTNRRWKLWKAVEGGT